MQLTDTNKRPKKGQRKSGSKIKPKNNNGAIAIQFNIDGRTYKFSPVHRGRFDNDMDMAKARQICEQISLDLLLGQFDPTLDKYRPIKAVKQQVQKEDVPPSYNIYELYLEYLANNRPEREKYSPSLSQAKRCLDKVDPRLYDTQKAWDMLKSLEKMYALGTLKNTFAELRTAVNWHIKRGKEITNSYADIVSDIDKRIVKNSTGKSKRAATQKDIEVIINAFRENAYSSPKAPDDNHSYYTNFVRFLFATGCRSEDARALEWTDIVEKGGKRYVKFSKAYTQTGQLKKTKNETIRLFPVNAQLEQILADANVQNGRYMMAGNKLIFPSKKGRYLNGSNFQRRHFKVIVDGLVADDKVSKYITQGNGRHSFITTMRAKGIPDAVIGALVETSPDMIANHYCDDDGLVVDLELPEI